MQAPDLRLGMCEDLMGSRMKIQQRLKNCLLNEWKEMKHCIHSSRCLWAAACSTCAVPRVKSRRGGAAGPAALIDSLRAHRTLSWAAAGGAGAVALNLPVSGRGQRRELKASRFGKSGTWGRVEGGDFLEEGAFWWTLHSRTYVCLAGICRLSL